MIRNSWYVAGLSDQFKFEPMKRVIAELPIVMWRTQSGQIVACEGRCSHKRFPLWEGRLLEDGTLQCAYHGWCYDKDGRCSDMPAQPGMSISPAANLYSYPVVEQDGLVWVWTGAPELADTIGVPSAPELANPAYDYVASAPIRVRANWRLLIENLLDITHFYPLHEGNIGDRANSEIPVDLVARVVDGNHTVTTKRRVANYRLPPYYQRWFDLETVDREHTHCMLNPSLVRVELRVAPPGKLGTEHETGYVLYHTVMPVDEQNLEWHWLLTCKAGEKFPDEPTLTRAEGIAQTLPDVVQQDEWGLVKQQEMLDLPLGTYRETNIKADIGVIQARRVLAQMHKAEGSKTEFFVPPTVLKA